MSEKRLKKSIFIVFYKKTIITKGLPFKKIVSSNQNLKHILTHSVKDNKHIIYKQFRQFESIYKDI